MLNYSPIIKIGIVHYNTPVITKLLIESIHDNVNNCQICVLDNSDTKPLDAKIPDIYIKDVLNFDKYQGRKYASYRHAKSVQWLLDNFSHEFVLFDSDTYLLKDFTPIIDRNYNIIGSAEISNHFGDWRIVPYFVYLNLPENYQFCDKFRFYNISHENRYDTGGSLYEDVQLRKLKFKEIDIYDYVIHYGGQSVKSLPRI